MVSGQRGRIQSSILLSSLAPLHILFTQVVSKQLHISISNKTLYHPIHHVYTNLNTPTTTTTSTTTIYIKMSTSARRRLLRDFRRLQNDPPTGVTGAPMDTNIMHWQAVIFGPDDTPWEGGTFKLVLEFTEGKRGSCFYLRACGFFCTILI